jgi:uncharacterized protein YqkB
MANEKITELTALASGSVDELDVLPIVDITDTSVSITGQTKKITQASLFDSGTSMPNLVEVGTIAAGTWTGAAVADAYVADDLTISGGTVDGSVIGGTTAAAGTFTQIDIEAQGDLRLQDSAGGQYVALQAPTSATSYTLTMPSAVGSSGQVLETSDGSGTLAWVTREVGDITGVTAGTNISITDPTGPVPTINVDNPVVADLTGDVTGNADTATLATKVTVSDTTADSELPVVLHDGNDTLFDDTGAFTYNPSNETVTTTAFVGSLTGDVTGDLTGNITGAATVGDGVNMLANGNVGISNSGSIITPSRLLHVAGSNPTIRIDGNYGTKIPYLEFAEDDTVRMTVAYDTSNDQGFISCVESGSDFYIDTGDKEGALFIDNTGQMGINTTVPTTTLDLRGTFYQFSTETFATGRACQLQSTLTDAMAVYGLEVRPTHNSSTSDVYGVMGRPVKGTGYSGDVLCVEGYGTDPHQANDSTHYGLVGDVRAIENGKTGTTNVGVWAIATNAAANIAVMIQPENSLVDVKPATGDWAIYSPSTTHDSYFMGSVDLAGSKLKIGGSYGSDGQVLTSTGSGVAWESSTVGDITGLTEGTNITITDAGGPVPTINVDNPVVANLTGNASGSSGSCTGNSATATLASTVTVSDTTADSELPVVLHDGANALFDDTGSFTYNPSNSTVTATAFVGALTGNADTATTASNVIVQLETTDITCYPLFATTSVGTLPVKSNAGFTFNSATGLTSSTGFSGPLTGDVTGNADTATLADTVTTNANLTGDVTSVGNATTIAAGAVDIAMLSASGTAGVTTFLRGDNSWDTPAGGGSGAAIGDAVTSATAGSVLFAGADAGSGGVLAQDNSNLFWDDSNDRLGIGTTVPMTAFAVSDGGAQGVEIAPNVSGNGVMRAYNRSGAAWMNMKFEALSHSFWTNGSSRMTIDSAGLIGVGTELPGSTVDIRGGVRFKTTSGHIKLYDTDGTYVDDFFTIEHDAGSLNIDFYDDSAVTTVNSVKIGSDASANSLVIDSTGVGIAGTVSATTRGVFGATANIASYSQIEAHRSGNPYIMGYDTRSSVTGTGGYIQWNVKGGDGNYDAIGLIGASCTTTHATLPGGELVFHVAEAGLAAAEAMRLSEEGDLGLGTAAPGSALWTGTKNITISDSSAAGYFLKNTGSGLELNIASDTGGVVYFDIHGSTDAADNAFAFRTENTNSSSTPTERMRITSEGQIFQPVESTTSTAAGSVSYEIDFNTSNLQTLVLDAADTDLTLTTTNATAGRTVRLYVENPGGLYDFSYPGGWKTLGVDPSSLSGFNYIVELTCWGTGDSTITADITEATS